VFVDDDAGSGCRRSVRVAVWSTDSSGDARIVGVRHGVCGRDATCDDCARADLAVGGRD
jgi:hypothetical protein